MFKFEYFFDGKPSCKTNFDECVIHHMNGEKETIFYWTSNTKIASFFNGLPKSACKKLRMLRNSAKWISPFG
jgi:hypothetical protein